MKECRQLPISKAFRMSGDAKTNEIKDILNTYRTVAVVGLSADPSKYSHIVAKFLQSRGWRIIPVNPNVAEVLGEKSYSSLLDLPDSLQNEVEVVDIFRRTEDVPPIVDQAVKMKQKKGRPYVVWMQLEIINEQAAALAREAGITVIMDKCMKIEIERLEREKDIELEEIRERKMKELTTKMKESRNSEPMPITIDDAHFDEMVQKHPMMLIDCWADWCGPCRMIAPAVDELARDYAGRVTIGKLNVDDNPQTAERFGIMSIPTLLIMKNAAEVDRITGAVPKHIIEEKLKKYV
jgi:thioredoxin